MVERAVQRDQSRPEPVINPASRIIRIGNGIDLKRPDNNLYSRGTNFENQCFRYLAQNAPDGTLVFGPAIIDSIPQHEFVVKPGGLTVDVSNVNVWTLLAFHEFKVGIKGKAETGRKIDGFTRIINLYRNKPYLLRKILNGIIGDEIPIPEEILIPAEDSQITFEFIYAIEKNVNQNKKIGANLRLVHLPYQPPPPFIRSLTPNYISTIIPSK